MMTVLSNSQTGSFEVHACQGVVCHQVMLPGCIKLLALQPSLCAILYCLCGMAEVQAKARSSMHICATFVIDMFNRG